MPEDTTIAGDNWSRQRQLLEAGNLSSALDRTLDCAAALGGSIVAVTIALADSQHELRHLLTGRQAPMLDCGRILFVDTMHALAPLLAGTRATSFGPYARADHQLLFPGCEGLMAVGLAPLIRGNRLIGSINVASGSPDGLDSIRQSGELDRIRVMAALAVENAVSMARWRRSGTVDLLTGWYNQQYFKRRLREEVARSERERQALACMLVDVDNFSDVNARFGYRAGDEVLLEVTHRIEAVIRSSDVAVRYGSEEFALLLPNTAAERDLPLIERIQRSVASAPVETGVAGRVAVTVSIGVAEHRPGGGRVDPGLAGSELLARTQLALYESQGRRQMVGDSGPLE
jgi:diguanylate cyclase (GGDEF)-like protein